MDNPHPHKLALLNLIEEIDVKDDVRSHVASCSPCSHEMEMLRGQLDEHRKLHTPEVEIARLVAMHEEKSRAHPFGWKRLVPALGVAMAAVAIGLFITPRDESPDGIRESMRIKGGLSAGVTIQRQSTVFVANEATRFLPGDRIRISVANPEGGQISVESLVDGEFQAIPQLSGIPFPGGLVSLPGSLTLDCQAEFEELRIVLTPQNDGAQESLLLRMACR